MFRFILLTFILFVSVSLRAEEGMWLLSSLKGFNETKMKELGLKIPIEEIVGNKGSLSEAVVSFGEIGTGSFISSEGLILTNYHCAYSAISQHNTPENNIVDDGYWALTKDTELKVKNLSVVIHKEIIDVSKEATALLKENYSPENIRSAIKAISENYQRKYKERKVKIKTYNNNKIFVLYAQEVCDDIRLVGLLPQKVAKFGGETDNWQWPRHNADFAYFRAYKNNVPYVPESYLKISREGYSKGDFSMVIGYPGMTNRQASSSKIWKIAHSRNPPLIEVRSRKLAIIDSMMRQDPRIKRKYHEDWMTSANYYKNSVGMNEWIARLDVVNKKKKQESDFCAWAKKDPQRSVKYASAIKYISSQSMSDSLYEKAMTYLSEVYSNSFQMLKYAAFIDSWLYSYSRNMTSFMSKENFERNVRIYFRRYDPVVDKILTKSMFRLIKEKMPNNMLPDYYETIDKDFNGNSDAFVDYVFENSIYADSSKIFDYLSELKYPENDPVILIKKSVDKKIREAMAFTKQVKRNEFKGYQNYQNGLVEYLNGQYYPNADKSIRLNYGTIDDLEKEDGVVFPYQTNTSGILEKSKSDNPDYYLDPRLKSLISEHTIPTCFITNGDVTGGNSGSPMLNSKGELIGVVFDCNWESMTRDFNYDIHLNRVICADINYILFLTENYGNAICLLNEIFSK